VFWKCAFLIVCVGACGAGVLAVRQQRLIAAGELARVQLRIATQDERLWALRAKIAEQTTPKRVYQMASTLGPLKPIIDSPRVPIVPGRAQPAIRVARGGQ
jgi:cell division protein FtsL